MKEINLKLEKPLSERESDVLEYICDGMMNREMADRFGLSIKTIENHVRSVLLKLGVKNRVQAAVKVMEAKYGPIKVRDQ